MGLMDKVKAQATVLADKAQTGLQQGQTKIQEMQSGKQVDHLLRELGAYVFLSERGRTQPDSETKVGQIMNQLDGLEAGGTAVAVTPESSAAPAAGTVPQTGAPAAPPSQPSQPSQGAVPTVADAVPQSGGGVPGAGGAIPEPGGKLPG